MRRLIDWLASQERALSNARAAATEMCRRTVERREVDLYLDEHGDGESRSA